MSQLPPHTNPQALANRNPLRPRIGVIALLFPPEPLFRARIEDILATHADQVLARFEHCLEFCAEELPDGHHVLCLLVKASTNELGALTGRLGMLKGLRLKTVLLD